MYSIFFSNKIEHRSNTRVMIHISYVI